MLCLLWLVLHPRPLKLKWVLGGWDHEVGRVLCVYSGKFVQGQALPGHKRPQNSFLPKEQRLCNFLCTYWLPSSAQGFTMYALPPPSTLCEHSPCSPPKEWLALSPKVWLARLTALFHSDRQSPRPWDCPGCWGRWDSMLFVATAGDFGETRGSSLGFAGNV